MKMLRYEELKLKELEESDVIDVGTFKVFYKGEDREKWNKLFDMIRLPFPNGEFIMVNPYTLIDSRVPQV